MKTQIIRKCNWNNGETELWETYAIRKTAKYLYLDQISRISGHYDITWRLPLSMEDELTKAYDNNEMKDLVDLSISQWAPVVKKERVY